MNPDEARRRFVVASKLITSDSTSIEKFESVRELIRGFNSKIDNLLESCSDAISKIDKLQKNDVIELSAESLPANTEEEKKRKKVILLFIRNWRDLQSEIERVRAEFEDGGQRNRQEQITSAGKIAAYAKGPFGILTILAVVIAGALIITNSGGSQNEPYRSSKVQVITYNGNKIPLSELRVGIGPECMLDKAEAQHYHAKNDDAVRAIDGGQITDPGGCGFGRVSELEVQQVDAI